MAMILPKVNARSEVTVPAKQGRWGEILLRSGLITRCQPDLVPDWQRLQGQLRGTLVLAILPLLMSGCGGGASLATAPPAPPGAILHSASSGTAEVGPTGNTVPVPYSARVISARSITGDTAPTGNITISASFPEKTERSNGPVQRLQLVTTGERNNQDN